MTQTNGSQKLITAKKDGKLDAQGKTWFEILINGKPIRLPEENTVKLYVSSKKEAVELYLSWLKRDGIVFTVLVFICLFFHNLINF